MTTSLTNIYFHLNCHTPLIRYVEITNKRKVIRWVWTLAYRWFYGSQHKQSNCRFICEGSCGYDRLLPSQRFSQTLQDDPGCSNWYEVSMGKARIPLWKACVLGLESWVKLLMETYPVLMLKNTCMGSTVCLTKRSAMPWMCPLARSIRRKKKTKRWRLRDRQCHQHLNRPYLGIRIRPAAKEGRKWKGCLCLQPKIGRFRRVLQSWKAPFPTAFTANHGSLKTWCAVCFMQASEQGLGTGGVWW